MLRPERVRVLCVWVIAQQWRAAAFGGEGPLLAFARCVRFASCRPRTGCSEPRVHAVRQPASASCVPSAGFDPNGFARQRVPFAAAPCGRTASLARRLDRPPAAVGEQAGSTSQTSAARSRPLAEGCNSPQGSCKPLRSAAGRIRIACRAQPPAATPLPESLLLDFDQLFAVGVQNA